MTRHVNRMTDKQKAVLAHEVEAQWADIQDNQWTPDVVAAKFSEQLAFDIKPDNLVRVAEVFGGIPKGAWPKPQRARKRRGDKPRGDRSMELALAVVTLIEDHNQLAGELAANPCRLNAMKFRAMAAGRGWANIPSMKE